MVGQFASFWSATEDYDSYQKAFVLCLLGVYAGVDAANSYKDRGYSVRCLQDM